MVAIIIKHRPDSLRFQLKSLPFRNPFPGTPGDLCSLPGLSRLCPPATRLACHLGLLDCKAGGGGGGGLGGWRWGDGRTWTSDNLCLAFRMGKSARGLTPKPSRSLWPTKESSGLLPQEEPARSELRAFTGSGFRHLVASSYLSWARTVAILSPGPPLQRRTSLHIM